MTVSEPTRRLPGESLPDYVRRSRREQGLPPTVTDPVVLRQLVELCVSRPVEEAA